MVNVAQALSSGVSGAAQYARASAASAAWSTEPVDNAAAPEAAAALPAEQTVLSVDRSYRYNSFEFSYRQDFGKIVLIRQRPDTGELVQQFPSEYYLRKYADSQRVAQSAANEQSNTGFRPGTSTGTGTGTGTKQTSAGSTPVVTTTPSPAPQQPAPSVAPAAPSLPSAPALPSAGASPSAPVNLTV
ncbi:hypothetical protein [Dongia rigui]|uniref:Uncharacterized protein n=1 Tax=Dongia rigui TaxID=940149 RepID=A0ABU5DVB8_9PROT|nr:hypothetical protein [Dongia rigui]MDY0870541.1 hypothetical protein [Dongia rigui]